LKIHHDSASTQAWFSGLAARTGTELQTLADHFAKLEAPSFGAWPIPTDGMATPESTEALLQPLQAFAKKGDRLLYVITVDAGANLQRIFSAFQSRELDATEEIGAVSGKRAYSRFNGINEESRCLYVGQSKDICKRLREHCGHGARRTYSLQLNHWAATLHLPLRLHCAHYVNSVNNDMLQALEDRLWNELKPMFGRRGPR